LRGGHSCAVVAGTALTSFLAFIEGESYDQHSRGKRLVQPINNIMKRIIAMAAVVLAVVAPLASAQSASTSPSAPLADVAKTEEARRKNVSKPAKVYTNGDLRTDNTAGVPAAPTVETPTAPAANATPGDNKTSSAPGASAVPAGSGQAYWSGRMKAARDQVARTQIFMDSLQSRINALTTDFVNRDDPAQRAKIEGDRQAALAELERVKKELAEQTKAIKTIEDEARRAGAPPGWLRPGA